MYFVNSLHISLNTLATLISNLSPSRCPNVSFTSLSPFTSPIIIPSGRFSLSLSSCIFSSKLYLLYKPVNISFSLKYLSFFSICFLSVISLDNPTIPQTSPSSLITGILTFSSIISLLNLSFTVCS